MPLDTIGKIAAAEIAFYTPIAVFTLLLVVQYAFRRDAGWFFLLIFSLSRIAGGAVLVAGQSLNKSHLVGVARILDYSCLFALLFSTLGFLGMAGQHTYSENPRVAMILRSVGLLGLVGLALSLSGGILGTQGASKQTMAMILRRVAVCVYAAMYAILVPVHIGTWTYRWHLRSYRRNLLLGISIALPFLGARIAYAVTVAWSSSDLYGNYPSGNPSLRKLNPNLEAGGDWVLYLVLGPVMEYVVVLLYIFASTILAKRHH